MKKTIGIIIASSITMFASAQVFKSSTGNIQFKSKTLIEEFTATNAEVEAAIAPAKNQIQFRVPVNGFIFKSALMQKHFQENYMETSKFPYSNYVGKIKDASSVNYAVDGEYTIESIGKLSIHGVTKDISITGKVVVKDGALILKSNFKVSCSDYGIKIPAASTASISNNIDITVDCVLAK